MKILRNIILTVSEAAIIVGRFYNIRPGETVSINASVPIELLQEANQKLLKRISDLEMTERGLRADLLGMSRECERLRLQSSPDASANQLLRLFLVRRGPMPLESVSISTDDIRRYIESRIGNPYTNKLGAIKEFRTITGWDLKSAKDWIEAKYPNSRIAV